MARALSYTMRINTPVRLSRLGSRTPVQRRSRSSRASCWQVAVPGCRVVLRHERVEARDPNGAIGPHFNWTGATHASRADHKAQRSSRETRYHCSELEHADHVSRRLGHERGAIHTLGKSARRIDLVAAPAV